MPTPNMVSVRLDASIREDLETYRRILPALVSSFEPSLVELASQDAMGRNLTLRRNLKLNLAPTVDWMLCLADLTIPPAELPMVHAVEAIGNGTFVILKDKPVDLADPADAALVAAVDPIIRRYRPPPTLAPFWMVPPVS